MAQHPHLFEALLSSALGAKVASQLQSWACSLPCFLSSSATALVRLLAQLALPVVPPARALLLLALAPVSLMATVPVCSLF